MILWHASSLCISLISGQDRNSMLNKSKLKLNNVWYNTGNSILHSFQLNCNLVRQTCRTVIVYWFFQVCLLIWKWLAPCFPPADGKHGYFCPSFISPWSSLKLNRMLADVNVWWLMLELSALPVIFADGGETLPFGTWPEALDVAIDLHLHSPVTGGPQHIECRQLSDGPLTRQGVQCFWSGGLLAGSGVDSTALKAVGCWC